MSRLLAELLVAEARARGLRLQVHDGCLRICGSRRQELHVRPWGESEDNLVGLLRRHAEDVAAALLQPEPPPHVEQDLPMPPVHVREEPCATCGSRKFWIGRTATGEATGAARCSRCSPYGMPETAT